MGTSLVTPTSLLVSDWFRLNISKLPWGNVTEIGLQMFSRAPTLMDNLDLSAVRSVHELPSKPGWLATSADAVPTVQGVPYVAPPQSLVYVTLSGSLNTWTLQLVDANMVPLSLEERSGWTFFPGVRRLEQETSALAVFYLKGSYLGVRDPILFYTTQGIGIGTTIREGSMFGQSVETITHPHAQPTRDSQAILRTSYSFGPRKPLSTYSRIGGLVTLVTRSRHKVTPGDLIVVTVDNEPTLNGNFIATATPDDYTVQFNNSGADVSSVSTGTVRVETNVYSFGDTLLQSPLPAWQPPGTEHVWFRPQRTNFIANPSFRNYNHSHDDFYGWTRGSKGSTISPYWGTSGTLASRHDSNGVFASTPDSTANSITGDIDLRVTVEPDSWRPAAAQTLIGKWNGPSYSYLLLLNTNGCFILYWMDSTGAVLASSSNVGIPSDTTGPLHVRVTLDVNNGAGGNTSNFYTSTDGIIWTALGTPFTQTGTTSILDSTSSVEIGSTTWGTANLFAGWVYGAEIRSNIDGPIVASYMPRHSYTAPTGEVWTYNGSLSLRSFGPEGAGIYLAPNGTSTAVLESNLFPHPDSDFLSVSLDAVAFTGSGTIRVGLIGWDGDYVHTTYIRTDDIPIDSDTVRTKLLFSIPETAASFSLRIESNVEVLQLNEVLVDPSISSYDYFDGSSTYSLDEDFSWHGGLPDAQFSLQYNNRKNIQNRLFGALDDSTQEYVAGLMEDWVPNGVSVIPHWEAIINTSLQQNWEGDYFYPIKDVTQVSVPDQEQLPTLKNAYPHALLTEDNRLMRDSNGEPIIVVPGTIPDTTLLTEDGQPVLTDINQYIVTG